MTDNILNQILNPVDQYWGYKNINYLKNIYIPKFAELNKLNAQFTKEQLRKLESKICTGKSKSLLADSLYNNVEILEPLTKNNVISDKFIIRIIDILVKFKEKLPQRVINFLWVYNLKKNGCTFSDEIMKNLTKIGFKSDDLNTQKYNAVELDFMNKLVNYNNIITECTDFLNKNTDFIPKSSHLKYFYDNINNNYFSKNPIKLNCFVDIFNFYELLLKHKYQITNLDINNLFNLFDEYLFVFNHKIYNVDDNISNQNLINIKKILQLFNSNNVYINQNHINQYMKNSVLRPQYSYTANRRYLEFLLIFKIIIDLKLENNNNEFIKKNYFELIAYDSNTSVLFAYKPQKEYYLEILNLLLNNNFVEITSSTLNKVLIKKDRLCLNFILEKSLAEPDEQSMNVACFSGDVEIIKTFINNKFIPNLNNVYCIKNCSQEILHVLIDYGGLVVTDELIEYTISKGIKLKDLEKHGYDTPEKKQLIEDLCVKHRRFPYTEKTVSEMETLYQTINSITLISEIEKSLVKFSSEKKLVGLIDHLINIGHFEAILYFKNKYPEIKPSLSEIYKSYYSKMYLDIFDLKN